MSEEKKGSEVVIEDKEVVTKETPSMTKEEMAEAGFSQKEIEMAEKQGMLKKDEKKKDEKPPEESDKTKEKKDDKKQPDDDKKGTKGTKKDDELTPEEEAEKVSKFNPNEKALYFKQKNERRKRQEMQAERDLLKIKNEAYERELNLLKQKGEKPDADATDKKDDEEDKERILTVGDLEKREKERAEKERLANEERTVKTTKLAKKIGDLEIEGKAKYADFDEVMTLAKEVLSENFDKSAKVRGLYNAFLEALTSEKSEDENAADIAYEIGKLHPKYKSGGQGAQDNKIPENKQNVDKILANQGKYKPSAAVGSGSGRKIVGEDDLTIEDASKLTTGQWMKLKPETRKRLLSAT